MKVISRLTYYRHGEPTYDIQSWDYDSPSKVISKVAALYEHRAISGVSPVEEEVAVLPSEHGSQLPLSVENALRAIEDLYDDHNVVIALRNKELYKI